MTFPAYSVKFEAIANIRINNQITAPEVRVTDEMAQFIGVMPIAGALKLAKEKGMDLIEIAPTAKPPVVRVMSFDKFRYQQEKKRKKERSQQKVQELKQIQISPREALHDLQVKMKKIEEFLAEGHQITIIMVLRGREKGNKDYAMGKLKDFAKMIPVEFKVIMEPKIGGRGIAMLITKK
ncbi:MAG: translation initiation factor IF-3 [Parcubacteria group bacterium Gr01-1014_3]|nr:MAG: translation initiation factor IF-3 [Parcubacteria group bacterium Gr01-1014_3]